MLDTDWGSSLTTNRALAAQSYPFSDLTTCVSLLGNKLPASLLLDVRLFFPPILNTASQTNVYVSRIVKTLDKFTIFFGFITGQDLEGVEFACCAGIPSDISIDESTLSRYFTVQPLTNALLPTLLSKVTGILIVGSTQGLLLFYTFLPVSTLLNPVCIQLFLSGSILALHINDIKVSGDVKLILAGGLRALNVGTLTDPAVRIYIDLLYMQKLQELYTQELLLLILSKYGRPVITINGVKPDSTGNITLSGSLCLSIEGRHGVLGTILFSNTCSSPCCQDSNTLLSLLEYILLLHNLQAILKLYFTSQANAVNYMQANLASLIVKGS